LLAEGEIYFRQGQYVEAHERYARIIKLAKTSPQYETAALHDGQCLVEMEQPKAAVAVLEELARWRPKSVYADEALLMAGNVCLEQLDQPTQADAAYRRLLTNYPQSELAREAGYRIGLVLFRKGRWEAAREIFEGERHLRGGIDTNAPPTELDRLIAACERKQPLVPSHGLMTAGTASRVNLADTFFTAREYRKAARTYMQVVQARPGTEEAAYCLMQAGRCHNQLHMYQQALRCYEQFLDKYRTSTWADDALIRAGVIYVGPLRSEKKGAAMYEAILERYPKGNQADKALFHLATLAYWHQRKAEAVRLYDSLLKQYPNTKFRQFVEKVQLPRLRKS
jgi:TolA-binding protein